MSDFTITDFFDRFPNDDKCLDHLWLIRFGGDYKCPKCALLGKFHRVRKRPVYECQCGHQISPMMGTPFAKSRTSLRKWFYAMYLFTTSRHGVPAKELQRQLGVTYKCAWRMGHEIRKYMSDVDGDGQYGGHVEMDETYIGGKKRHRDSSYKLDRSHFKDKTIVYGMVERNGSLQTYVIDRRTRKNIQKHVDKKVVKGTTISTDEAPCYQFLGKAGYVHGAVCHEQDEYVVGIHHTNTIEGFWSRLKSSIRGTHIHVSKKYLPNYLGEFEYRYNMRKSPKWMFERLLGAF